MSSAGSVTSPVTLHSAVARDGLDRDGSGEERRVGVRGHGAPQSHRCNDWGRHGRYFDRHTRTQTIMKFAKVRATQR
jgi:hypothetical protein